MKHRHRTRLAPLLAALSLAAAALAGEPDPWATERDQDERERMEELADAEARGDVEDELRLELDRYWATHLRRCPMNAIESARYSAAEIRLRQGNAKDAVRTLERALTDETPAELRNVTHLNLAEIHRRRLRDVDAAAKHYAKVSGPLRHLARSYMLRMLTEAGKTDQAVKTLKRLADEAKEKGEKLALLHRLAAFYKRQDAPEQALAVYERITKEFTPDDIRQMRQAAVREAEATIQRIIQLQQQEHPDDAERLERQIHLRARDLRLAGRHDELKAFERAADAGFRRLRRLLEELEAREEEAERRERDDDDEPRRRRERPDDDPDDKPRDDDERHKGEL